MEHNDKIKKAFWITEDMDREIDMHLRFSPKPLSTPMAMTATADRMPFSMMRRRGCSLRSF